MTKTNNSKVTDTALLKRLISMLPFAIERILYTGADDTESFNVSLTQCLGLSAIVGGDIGKVLKTALDGCNLDKNENILADALTKEINKHSLSTIITVTDSISDIEGIEIPEDKKPIKRNDDELTNKVIIDACSMMFMSIIDYIIGLARIKADSKEAKETSSIIKESCQVNLILILGLIDKLGMKPEDAITMAATKALVTTENGTDEQKLTKEEINIIIDEITDYLPCSLSECTNMVYDMID